MRVGQGSKCVGAGSSGAVTTATGVSAAAPSLGAIGCASLGAAGRAGVAGTGAACVVAAGCASPSAGTSPAPAAHRTRQAWPARATVPRGVPGSTLNWPPACSFSLAIPGAGEGRRSGAVLITILDSRTADSPTADSRTADSRTQARESWARSAAMRRLAHRVADQRMLERRQRIDGRQSEVAQAPHAADPGTETTGPAHPPCRASARSVRHAPFVTAQPDLICDAPPRFARLQQAQELGHILQAQVQSLAGQRMHDVRRVPSSASPAAPADRPRSGSGQRRAVALAAPVRPR